MDKPHFLVTAGSTHEPIDQVRVWSNIFTGKTGLDLALALLDVGGVTLLTSNREHHKAYDGYSGSQGMLGVELFDTHGQLKQLLAERMQARTDGVFMSAAVSDYAPEGVFQIVSRKVEGDNESWIVKNVQEPKVRSTHGAIAIVGRPTEKLIDLFRTQWGYRGLLVKFKLQAAISEEELVRIAGASRLSSGADYIVANTLEMVGGPNAGAFIIGERMCERVARERLARRVADLAGGAG